MSQQSRTHTNVHYEVTVISGFLRENTCHAAVGQRVKLNNRKGQGLMNKHTL